VDTRLVRHFDRDTEIAEYFIRSRLGVLLGRLAQVRRIEVEEVVVLDVAVGRSARLQIPDRLEQAARDQPGVRKGECLPAREDRAVGGVERDVVQERVFHGALIGPTRSGAGPSESLSPGSYQKEVGRRSGWERSDENNYSLVISPDGSVAIAVATGDDATGRTDVQPATKSSKGPSTAEAVSSNQLQLDFGFPPIELQTTRSTVSEEPRMTWMLLVHRAVGEVRAELSLPDAMGVDGRVDSWRERIILGAIPTDPHALEITPPTPPDQPDVDVDVKRKA